MKSLLCIFVPLLLLAIAQAHALNCSSTVSTQICTEIQNANIPPEEKAYLLADIMSFTKHYPDHQLVEDWNDEISLTTSPNEVQTENRGSIRNAWVKIIAVMPSVQYDNKLFIDTNGKILTGFNHDLQIPSSTASGDCRTDRRLVENTGTLHVYVNNIFQGSDHTTSYSAPYPDNTPVNIKVEYTIQVRTRIKHYKYRYEDDRGYRRRVCQYSNTEYKADRLTVTNELEAVLHNPDLSASFTVTDKYEDTTKGEFLFNGNIVNAELLFEDSYLKQHHYVFSEITLLPPLNVLIVKAEKLPSVEEQNLAYGENIITLKNTNACKIKLFSFFKNNIRPCNLSFERPKFTVSIDKTVYESGEPLKITIEPVGFEYIVTYGDQQITTTGNTELTAEFPSNKITVQRGNRIVKKYIHVKNEEPLAAGFSIAIFGTLNYALIGIVKRYWGVLG